MLETGAIDEVAEASESGLSSTAAKAIGVAEILSLQRGEISFDTCLEAIRRRTRRYAKRQETWFRREPEFHALPVGDDEAPETTAQRIAEHFGLAN
jgi:tRNA dimethylallyltransferase